MAVVARRVQGRAPELLVAGHDALDDRARAALLGDLLRVVSPAQLEVLVHRCERTFPAWALPGTGSVHERLARFLAERS
ncbi:MAG TPA: hypothetical protein VMD09_12755 [Solirubrobacteraceae bacterium]|nr:hypothetical protein [Solirubrobacteraceae bacterium]